MRGSGRASGFGLWALARAGWFAVAVIVTACGEDRPAAPPVRRDAGSAAHVVAPDAAVTRGYIGVITAAESVDIAPRFQGVIASVDVRPGDSVTAGQIVAEMDQKSMEEELRAAKAALGSANAAERQAEVDVADAKRKLRLETRALAEGISPRSAVDEAKMGVERAYAAAAQAASTVAQEKSHVQTAQDHLNDLALRAPADGTVAMRFKDPGSTVEAGTAILRVVGKGGLRLKFAVPPEQAGKLAPGGTVHAEVETVATPVTATIRQVSPALDPSSGMIIVEAELAGPAASDGTLRPGLAAWVK